MAIVRNTHEPLVSQEIWDKIRGLEKSVSKGKRTKNGETMPLSGLIYCADCGEKMRLCMNNTIDLRPKCTKIHKKLRNNSAGERKPKRFRGRLLIRSTTA
ncbi:MAG: hypothetical protein NC452_07740 [Eubacterium sp.]|nr:hypothetical protein [Eubacterium sp.]